MRDRETTTVLNTPCVLTDRQRLRDDLVAWCRRSQGPGVPPLSVDFTNVHIVALRTMDRGFFASTSTVDWFVSDSQILSWAVSFVGGEGHQRVYGPDFMDYFFRNGEKTLTHYFLGASDHCLAELMKNLSALQPGLQVAGRHNGYFKEGDESAIVDGINSCEPDILWVGLGTPKQQEWIARHKAHLKCKAILAVGFAFDVNAGTKKDAPAWLGPLGLTWLYRLLSEPRRLWKRYLVYNSVFLFRLAIQRLSGRPSPSPAGESSAVS